MFLAPLNYDRFFKKIFSDKRIAKRFLEDFFEVTIEEIDLVSLDHKLTNEAHLLHFDFRCKVDGQYMIVDMQQWYKQDIVQRFYVYHTANTVLQLENLPTIQPTKEKKVKDYRTLMPVKTLIWLVDDTLQIKDDFLIHQMLPSELLNFVENDSQWTNDAWEKAQATRTKILNLLNNKAKDLPFLRSNQLIFAFQKNIVKNQKMKPYVKWFEFAQKTRDENNQKSDFETYVKDEVFSEIIRKLSHKSLDAEDLSFIEYYRLLEGQKDVWESQYKAEGERTAWQKAQVQIEQAENKAQQAENKAQQMTDRTILALIQNSNLNDAIIASTVNVPIERVQQIRSSQVT
ncbi:MAG: hypothetical protein AB8G86_13450 [Saprospiraceae bacterium]